MIFENVAPTIYNQTPYPTI
uniref:Uncharacterized protein n=1 Tax=Anguilla anguilla TaxID=7936 RepID=A0A0E9SUL7_ANGAN